MVHCSDSVGADVGYNLLVVPTYSSSQTHDEEEDNTPQNISIQAPLQQAALVPRPAVVHHSFGFVTWNTQNKNSNSGQNINLNNYILLHIITSLF